METDRPALAIDIGGTKLAAGVVEPGGRLVTWEQTPTPRDLDGEQLWRTVDALISRVLDAAEFGPRPGSAADAAARWSGRPASSPR
jgi:glucokinase